MGDLSIMEVDLDTINSMDTIRIALVHTITVADTGMIDSEDTATDVTIFTTDTIIITEEEKAVTGTPEAMEVMAETGTTITGT